MDILIIALMSALLFFAALKIQKKTKIAPPIVYLVTGILLGGSLGVLHIFGNEQLLPSTNTYNGTILLMMFFGAGFNIDLKKLKASGKEPINMSILPIHIEAIIMTVVVAIGLAVLPLGFEVGIFYLLIIMTLFACASPANAVPACLNLNAKGFTGKNRITDMMLTATVFDNFTPFPLLIVALLVAVAPGMGLELSPIMLIGAIIAIILVLGLALVVSYFLGGLVAKILSPLSDKVAQNPTNKIFGLVYTLVAFAVMVIMTKFAGPLAALDILLIIGMVVGFNAKEKNGIGAKLGLNSNIIFAILGLPMIFATTGGNIDLTVLLNPMLLVFGIAVTYIAIAVKGFVTSKIVMKDEKYTDGERKFASACFVPKGVTLINMSLILGPVFAPQAAEFLVIIGCIGILSSVPVGITLMNSAGGKWIFKEGADSEEAEPNSPETC